MFAYEVEILLTFQLADEYKSLNLIFIHTIHDYFCVIDTGLNLNSSTLTAGVPPGKCLIGLSEQDPFVCLNGGQLIKIHTDLGDERFHVNPTFDPTDLG